MNSRKTQRRDNLAFSLPPQRQKLLVILFLIVVAFAEPAVGTVNRVAEREYFISEIERLRGEEKNAADGNDYKRAAVASAEVLKLTRRISSVKSATYAQALDEHASNLYWDKKFADAERFSAQAWKLRRHILGKGHVDTLDSMWFHAGIVWDLGRYDQAIRLYQAELPLRRKLLGDNHDRTIYGYNWLASQLNILGRVADAVPLAAEIVKIRGAHYGEAHSTTIQALYGQGYLLSRIQRYDEADLLYAKGLRLRRTISRDDMSQLDAELEAYVSVLNHNDRASVAEPYLAELVALRRSTLLANDPKRVRALHDYGKLLLQLNRDAEAVPILTEALRLNREVNGENHLYTRENLGDLADAYASLERYEAAEKLYAERLRIAREQEDWQLIAIIEDNARFLFGQNRFEAAEPLYAEALNMRIALGKKEAQRDLATIWRAQDLAAVQLLQPTRRIAAIRAARFAVDGARVRYVDLLGSDIERENSKRFEEGAVLSVSDNLFLDAAWFASQADRADIQALRSEAFVAIQELSAGITSRAVAVAAGRRYAATVDASDLLSRRNKLAEERITLSRDIYEADGEIGDAAARRRQQLSRRNDALDREREATKRALLAKAPQYFSIISQPALDLAEARALLRPDEVAVVIEPWRHGTHIMGVSREGLIWHRTDLNEKKIGEMVSLLRRGLEVEPSGRTAATFDLETAHRLYVALIAPIVSSLSGKSYVYIVAGGALAGLPLGTLVTKPPAPGASANDLETLRRTRWLADSDDRVLVQLPSLQSLAYLRRFNNRTFATTGGGRRTRLAAYGNPLTRPIKLGKLLVDVTTARAQGTGATAQRIMDPAILRRLPPLPETANELKKVGELLHAPSSDIYLGKAMTERAIRRQQLAAVQVLHFATHGLTAKESGIVGEPGLVFSQPHTPTIVDDGYLAASEVLALDLKAIEWVILSACNTAAPAGGNSQAGLSGLASAFFYAGSPSLLVSHWSVHDDIAADLTVGAIEYMTKGLSRGEAIREALRDIRAAPDKAHPSIWGAYSLVGEAR